MMSDKDNNLLKSDILTAGSELSEKLNAIGVPNTFGKASEGKDNLISIIRMTINGIDMIIEKIRETLRDYYNKSEVNTLLNGKSDTSHNHDSAYAKISHNHDNAYAHILHQHNSQDVIDLIDVIYPVGSIYMSVNNTSPSVLFGGTWEQIEDTFLLASGTNYATGTTGGEATHTLTTNEMPIHYHREANSTVVYNNSSSNRFATSGSGTKISLANGLNINTNPTGDGQAHNNMPPYLTVNVWKRIE